MKNEEYLKIWAVLYILCGLLGFIPDPGSWMKAISVLLAAAFFVPGGVLLYRACKEKNKKQLRFLRNLSVASLGATFAALLLNFLSVMFPELIGDFLYGVLVLVSVPMVCSRYWAVSMFCWALIMCISGTWLKQAKSKEN